MVALRRVLVPRIPVRCLSSVSRPILALPVDEDTITEECWLARSLVLLALMLGEVVLPASAAIEGSSSASTAQRSGRSPHRRRL